MSDEMGADEFSASVPALKVLADSIIEFNPDRLFPPIVMGTLTINPFEPIVEEFEEDATECTMRSSASAGAPLYVCNDGLYIRISDGT
jgi:hypothetical protein